MEQLLTLLKVLKILAQDPDEIFATDKKKTDLNFAPQLPSLIVNSPDTGPDICLCSPLSKDEFILLKKNNDQFVI